MMTVAPVYPVMPISSVMLEDTSVSNVNAPDMSDTVPDINLLSASRRHVAPTTAVESHSESTVPHMVLAETLLVATSANIIATSILRGWLMWKIC